MTVLTTISCVVSAAGISRPAFADILETLQAQFKSIYGSDVYIDPDSKDGQLLAAVAKAIDDENAGMVATYNGFSPATAQGAALSNQVRINGLQRNVPTSSTVTIRVTGVSGTVITAGSIASDANGVRWVLPGGTIPATGFLDMVATSEAVGAIDAAIGTITLIQTPIRGWQSVTNTTSATVGAPVETDAALRRRQASSVMIPAQTVLEGIAGAIRTLPGVIEVRPYENATAAMDTNGIPARCIVMAVRGGVAADIAGIIMRKKTPGITTYGNTSVNVVDRYGQVITIQFTIPTAVRIVANIGLQALGGYQVSYADTVKQYVADYINALGIGRKVDLGRLYVPAQLNLTNAASPTFEVNSITIARFGNAAAAADVPIAYNEVATAAVGDITVTVT